MEGFDITAIREKIEGADVTGQEVISALLSATAGAFVMVGNFVGQVINLLDGAETNAEELGSRFAETFEMMYLKSLEEEIDGRGSSAAGSA